AEVLQAHPVDALVDGRDELDERDEGAVEDDERLRQQDLRHGPAVPDVLNVGGRVPLEEGPHVNVLLPLGDTVREVAEGIRGDVDAARRQPVALLSDEGQVVTDDVLDRIRHDPTPPGRGQAPVMLGGRARRGDTIPEAIIVARTTASRRRVHWSPSLTLSAPRKGKTKMANFRDCQAA